MTNLKELCCFCFKRKGSNKINPKSGNNSENSNSNKTNEAESRTTNEAESQTKSERDNMKKNFQILRVSEQTQQTEVSQGKTDYLNENGRRDFGSYSNPNRDFLNSYGNKSGNMNLGTVFNDPQNDKNLQSISKKNEDNENLKCSQSQNLVKPENPMHSQLPKNKLISHIGFSGRLGENEDNIGEGKQNFDYSGKESVGKGDNSSDTDRKGEKQIETNAKNDKIEWCQSQNFEKQGNPKHSEKTEDGFKMAENEIKRDDLKKINSKLFSHIGISGTLSGGMEEAHINDSNKPLTKKESTIIEGKKNDLLNVNDSRVNSGGGFEGNKPPRSKQEIQMKKDAREDKIEYFQSQDLKKSSYLIHSEEAEHDSKKPYFKYSSKLNYHLGISGRIEGSKEIQGHTEIPDKENIDKHSNFQPKKKESILNGENKNDLLEPNASGENSGKVFHENCNDLLKSQKEIENKKDKIEEGKEGSKNFEAKIKKEDIRCTNNKLDAHLGISSKIGENREIQSGTGILEEESIGLTKELKYPNSRLGSHFGVSANLEGYKESDKINGHIRCTNNKLDDHLGISSNIGENKEIQSGTGIMEEESIGLTKELKYPNSRLASHFGVSANLEGIKESDKINAQPEQKENLQFTKKGSNSWTMKKEGKKTSLSDDVLDLQLPLQITKPAAEAKII